MKQFQSKLNALLFAAASTLVLSGSAYALTPNPLGGGELVPEIPGLVVPGPVIPGIVGGILWQPFDTKTFSGGMCQPYFGSQAGDFNQTHYSMYNKTNGFRSISCPLVRDNVNNLNGPSSVVMNVKNGGAPSKLSCTAYSYKDDGTLLASNAKNTSSAGVSKLIMYVNKSAKNGHYSIYCSLPKYSSVLSYQIFEFLRTDNNN